MTEPRFRTLAPEEWSEAQRRVAAALTKSPRGAVRGPYIPLIHSPELADRMRHLGDFIRFAGVLPPRLKEIVILTVARHWSADFMFAIHRENSAELGLERAIVDAIARGERPPGLAAAEQAGYDAARELLAAARMSDATFAAAKRGFGEAGTIELVTFVGYYTTLAMVLNAGAVALPPGAAPLPPLG
jgi:4-carboxymuconolactone decarboxylase